MYLVLEVDDPPRAASSSQVFVDAIAAWVQCTLHLSQLGRLDKATSKYFDCLSALEQLDPGALLKNAILATIDGDDCCASLLSSTQVTHCRPGSLPCTEYLCCGRALRFYLVSFEIAYPRLPQAVCLDAVTTSFISRHRILVELPLSD